MKEVNLIMSKKEREKLEILSKVKNKNLNLKEASEILRISYRQTRRIYKKYLVEGDKGLVHKLRGKSSNRGKPKDFKDKIISIYREKYSGFGPTFASEKLAEEDILIDHCTLWQWLIKTGDWSRNNKEIKYRARRKKRPHFGELVHFDGSEHTWFEERGKACTLMNMVDDATGITYSKLFESESTKSAMEVLWEWIEKYGIPHSLYLDHHITYEPTKEGLTEFARACNELGIEIIHASSPQAKGRVERNHAVYQDRFVKELKLKNINTIKDSNKFLRESFIDNLNSKFSKIPENNIDFHRKIPGGTNLERIFCKKSTRIISNDWTVRFKNEIYQIIGYNNLPKTKVYVEILEYLDDTVHIIHNNEELKYLKIKSVDISNKLIKSTNKKKDLYISIKELRHNGYSFRKIGLKLGICPETAKKYIDCGGIYIKKSPGSKLSKYYSQIDEYISKDYCSAKIHKFLVSKGFRVSYPLVNIYVKKRKLEL